MRTKESARRVPWKGLLALNKKSPIKYQRATKTARKTAPIQHPIYMEIDLDSDDEDNQSTEGIIISTDSDSDEESKQPSYKELREENLKLLYEQRKVQKEYDEEKQRRRKLQKEYDELKEWKRVKEMEFMAMELSKKRYKNRSDKYLKRLMSLTDEIKHNIRGGV